MAEMPLIAGIYRIIEKIGAGGGGIVYLAEHMRLKKKVVLKATKGTLSRKPEKLRREVDALKDLNHANIPQVYDFVEENGTVYTVMDYIDGESLDNPLKRGVRFGQAQVIEWAVQLLEAIEYLHSRPPYGILHADIKPANVMITPQGDVRLIDFNIALALGEEGAVAVGRSFGYASPEHYGLGFSSENTIRSTDKIDTTDLSDDTATQTLLDTQPQPKTQPQTSQSSTTAEKKTKILDVRSDIYSLGATLYHIVTGIRPEKDATKVRPIPTGYLSPTVVAIIEKAMNPIQELRWQSAKEMLNAFKNLRETDPRAKRFKKAVTLTAAVLSLVFLAGGIAAFAGQGLMEQEQRRIAGEQTEIALLEAERAEDEARRAEQEARRAEEEAIRAEEEARRAALNEAHVLSEYSANSLREGDIDAAISFALQATTVYDPPIAEAHKALADALMVYDLSDGFKNHRTVELPSAPLDMRISPDGKTAAAVYSSAVAVFDTESGMIIASLPAEQSALAEVKFLNNNTIIYAGEGGVRAYDFLFGIELWAGSPGTSISISADGRSVAAVYRNESFATVYDTLSGSVLHEVSFDGKQQSVVVNDIFANPNDNLFALNRDGTLLGVSFADGSLLVFDLRDSSGNIEIFDETSGYTQFEGGFHRQFLTFAATNQAESLFAVVDTTFQLPPGGFDSASPFAVQADEGGIVFRTDNLVVGIDPETGEQRPLVTTFERVVKFAHSGAYTLMTSGDELMFFDSYANLVARHDKEHGSEFLQIAGDTVLIGSLDTPVIKIMKFESHPHAEVFSYDPSYRHDEARISADRLTVMLFSYEGFRLFGIGGELITEVNIPDAEKVHDQQFRRDEGGSRLEVIYNDGTIRAYSAQDGSVLYETAGERPDLTLFEEYFTDELRIESPLHGTPIAYDIRTGEFVRELGSDDFLAYFTQVGEYIVAEYVTGEGFRYGLLLNGQCETLAHLPYLSDIIEDRLIFNYPTGNLRESRIYNIEELIGLARG